MHSRLLKLEEAVFGKAHQLHVPRHRENVNTSSPMTPWSEADDQDDCASSRQLEDICGGLKDGSPYLAQTLVLETKAIHELALDQNHLQKAKTISLPPAEFAMRVLDIYEDKLASAQQIMHIPTVRAQFRSLYEHDPKQDASSRSGSIALLHAMSAQMAFWDMLSPRQLFETPDLAKKTSTRFVQYAMDALDHARNLSDITVETIQAALLLVFLFFHVEGFSSRGRILQSTALTMARELGLHKTDAARNISPSFDRSAMIDAEVRRKLWWYMTASDWLLAFNSGPTEGVYTVIPQQMRVKRPRNLMTDDLQAQDMDFERSRDEATNMAYYFFRIDLAGVCRNAVDSMVMQDPKTVPYEKVRAIDKDFDALAVGLPYFMQLDTSPRAMRQDLGDQVNVQIGIQRALANLMLNLRRCKFHLPYLIRWKDDSRYAFSRSACLAAAQKLLEVRRAFLDDSTWHTSSFLYLLGLYRFVFYSAMVLVIDLCVNKSEDDSAQLLQIRDALDMVEEMSSTSHTAAKFLKALHDVLHKHGRNLPTVENGSNRSADAVPSVGTEGLLSTPENSIDATIDFADFELLWPENLADDPLADSRYWDDLINLDMRL